MAVLGIVKSQHEESKERSFPCIFVFSFHCGLKKIKLNWLLFATAVVSLALLQVYGAGRSIVISEMMPRPEVGEEWIELINMSDSSVNLAGFTLTDLADNTSRIDTAFVLLPGRYLVLLQDEGTDTLPGLGGDVASIEPDGWAILNNDGDEVVLRDSTEVELDRVSYTGRLTKRAGVSLERIDLFDSGTKYSNWGTCVDVNGHTAGRKNSLRPPEQQSLLKLDVEPNPFSPDDDGFEDTVTISFTVPATQAKATVGIYDLAGNRVRRLAMNRSVGQDETSLIWDGLDERGRILPVGRYVVLLEAFDYSKGSKLMERCSVVLAKKL